MNLDDLPKTLDEVPADSKLGRAIQRQRAAAAEVEQAAAEVRRWEEARRELQERIAGVTLDSSDSEILAAIVAERRLPLVETQRDEARAAYEQALEGQNIADRAVGIDWEYYQRMIHLAGEVDAETREHRIQEALKIVGPG